MSTTPACYECGGEMVVVHEKAEIRIGNRSAIVRVDRSRCKACDEIFYTPDQMDAAQMAATELLRKEDGLLGPADIRRIRMHYGLTQAQLEQLLGVGPKTVVRWERGTVFQSRTADELLRIIMDMPFVFEYLARKNNIAQCPLTTTPKQESRYVSSKRTSTPERVGYGRRVIDMAESVFRSTIQEKPVHLEREAMLPNFLVEAMR